MGRVHRLVTEHPVNREELGRTEAIGARFARPRDGRGGVRTLALDGLLGVVLLPTTARRELVQHGRGGRGGVGAQEELAGLLV